MGGLAGALTSFSPARIIHSYAGDLRGAIASFEKGGDELASGAKIVGDSSTGGAKPELVVTSPMSSIINNKNLETLAGLVKAATGAAGTPAAGTKKMQTINVILKLDGDVLAQHTRKIANDVLITNLEFNQ